jgi:uncharacterized protein
VFQLELFGGEPLSAWSVVETLALNASAICKKNGTAFIGSMTTNAVLLNQPRLDILATNGINGFQITLDGPEYIHNKRRIDSRGTGSFRSVWSALQLIKASHHQVKVSIRVHFDPETLPALIGSDGFIRDLARSFVKDDDRFSLHFHALGRLGGPNDHAIQIFAAKEEALAILTEEMLNTGCKQEQVSGYPSFCYAASANSFVIRSDGRVAKCTVAFEDARNTVGKLLENGDMIIDHSKHLLWLRGLISGEPSALACPLGDLPCDDPSKAALTGVQVTGQELAPAL